jgi:hypothetical protein
MSEREHVAEPKNFEPKVPVQLDPPKTDPISLEHLAKCDGAYLWLSSKQHDVHAWYAYRTGAKSMLQVLMKATPPM